MDVEIYKFLSQIFEFALLLQELLFADSNTVINT